MHLWALPFPFGRGFYFFSCDLLRVYAKRLRAFLHRIEQAERGGTVVNEWVKRFMDLASPQQKTKDTQAAAQAPESGQGTADGLGGQGMHPSFSPFATQAGATPFAAGTSRGASERPSEAKTASPSLSTMIRERLQGFLPKKAAALWQGGSNGKGEGSLRPGGYSHPPQMGMRTAAPAPHNVGNGLANQGMFGSQPSQMPPMQMRVPASRFADPFMPHPGMAQRRTPAPTRFSSMQGQGFQTPTVRPYPHGPGMNRSVRSRMPGYPNFRQSPSFIDPYTGQPRRPQPPMPPGFF